MAMLKMYTTTWCPDCRRAKQYLRERGIEFEEIDIETTPGAVDIVESNNQGRQCVPTFDRDGHFFNCSPFDANVLRRELNLN